MLVQTENLLLRSEDTCDNNNNNGGESQFYQDPITGAHFRFADVCVKLMRLQKERERLDAAVLSAPPETEKFAMASFVTNTIEPKVADFGPAGFATHTLKTSSEKLVVKRQVETKKRVQIVGKNRNSMGIVVNARKVQARKMLEPYMASPACLSADRSAYRQAPLQDRRSHGPHLASPRETRFKEKPPGAISPEHLFTCASARGDKPPRITSGRESVCSKEGKSSRRAMAFACFQPSAFHSLAKRVSPPPRPSVVPKTHRILDHEEGGAAENQEGEGHEKSIAQHQVGEKCPPQPENVKVVAGKGHRKTGSVYMVGQEASRVTVKIRPMQSKKRIPTVAGIYAGSSIIGT